MLAIPVPGFRRVFEASALVVALALVVLGLPALAQAQATREVRFDVDLGVGERVLMDHLVFLPAGAESGTERSFPLLVFLHGSGERGDDLERVEVHGPPKITETRKDFPFVVVSPQCASGTRWNPDAVLRLVDHAIAEYPVDPDRVYLTGLSMGGFGTWSTAALAPGRFAAIAPICGGASAEIAARLRGLPIWAFHGANDTAVPIERTTVVIEALRALGESPRFTVYEGVGHDSWTRTYENEELWTWLLSHRRSQRAGSLEPLPRVPPESVGMSRDALAGVDRALAEAIAEEELAGAIVMVARRGRLVHAVAAGQSDREAGEEMRLDSVVRIYSMTKPICSVAAMTLVEEGRLGLDDPVEKHLPELAGLRVWVSGSGDSVRTEETRRSATVRDLLRHTAGLTYGFMEGGEYAELLERANPLDSDNDLSGMVSRLSKLPLRWQPGEKWNYSVSVDVLGRVIEVVANEPLDRFLQRRIFDPLEMRDTAFFADEERARRLATVYTRTPEGELRPIDSRRGGSRFTAPPKLLSGGGGLVSTAGDYLRFATMLERGGELDGRRVLQPRTVASMTRNQLVASLCPIAFGPVSRPGLGFGLGFSVRYAESADMPGSRVGEYGWGGAASTQFWISPTQELCVVVITQRMPYTDLLERRIKPLVDAAILEQR